MTSLHYLDTCMNQSVHFLAANGFSITIILEESNLAPLIQAVDHSEYNNNDDFHGDPTITRQYCPYPVPETYQLSLVMCARAMSAFQGLHSCNTTGESAHESAHESARESAHESARESAHPEHCFSCCRKQACSENCQMYYDSGCEPVRYSHIVSYLLMQTILP